MIATGGLATSGRLAGSGELAGRVAVVTGASTGVGQGIALALARAGASIVVGYHRDAAGARVTCDAITMAGDQAVVCEADIATQEGADALVAAARVTGGVST